jgi:hypothetical protein
VFVADEYGKDATVLRREVPAIGPGETSLIGVSEEPLYGDLRPGHRGNIVQISNVR